MLAQGKAQNNKSHSNVAAVVPTRGRGRAAAAPAQGSGNTDITLKLCSGCARIGGRQTRALSNSRQCRRRAADEIKIKLKLRRGCAGSGRQTQNIALELRSCCAGAGGDQCSPSTLVAAVPAQGGTSKNDMIFKLRNGCAGAGEGTKQ